MGTVPNSLAICSIVYKFKSHLLHFCWCCCWFCLWHLFFYSKQIFRTTKIQQSPPPTLHHPLPSRPRLRPASSTESEMKDDDLLFGPLPCDLGEVLMFFSELNWTRTRFLEYKIPRECGKARTAGGGN